MNRSRAFLSALLALGLVVLGGVVAVSASAHTPAVSKTCDKLTVSLKSYNSHGTNTVVVTIDGTEKANTSFSTQYVKSFDAPDRYTSFHYTVAVTAHDDPTGSKGWTKTFTGDSTPCERPVETKPSGSYDQECVEGGVQVTIGQLDKGTYNDVTWTLTHGNDSTEVTSGQKVLVKSGDALDLSWHSGESSHSVKSGEAKDCPVAPEETAPSGSFSQECVEGGVQVTIGQLDDGTYGDVSWTFTHGNASSEVSSGQKVLVQSGEALDLSWNSGESSHSVKSGTAKECEIAEPEPTFGKIKIKKDIEGPVAGAGTTFTVRVDCPGTAYDQDVLLTPANGYVNTTGNIASGTTCTLTEVKVPNGWNPEGITPDSVTVGTGTPSQVSAVVFNKRRTGRVEVVKHFEGEAPTAGTTFTAHLECDGTDWDYDLVLKASNNWTVTVKGIPSGIDCVVTEPSVPAGWMLKSITPSEAFTIDSYDTIPVEVVNARTPVTPPTPPTPPTLRRLRRRPVSSPSPRCSTVR